jgi:hypothetical protein
LLLWAVILIHVKTMENVFQVSKRD